MDDVKQRKQKNQETIKWYNQTPAQANETKKKYRRFLHRGKAQFSKYFKIPYELH